VCIQGKKVPFAPPETVHTLWRLGDCVRLPNVGRVSERQDGDLFHGQPQQIDLPTACAIVIPANEVLIPYGQC